MADFFRNIPRHFKEAYNGLGRNMAMTLSSASAVTVTLVLIAVFLVVALNVQSFTTSLEQDVKIHVKIDDSVSEENIDGLKLAISKIEGVREVVYSSKDTELTELIAVYGEEGQVFESYRGEQNPLKNAFIVEVKHGEMVDDVTSSITKIPGIYSALYGGKNILQMMSAFDSIRSGGLIFVLFLSSLAIFLISNTIKLTIFARQNEISIMRLVGASNGFIRTPFLIEGMFIGLLGALIPILLTIFGYAFIFDVCGGVFFTPLFPLKVVYPFVYNISAIIALLGMIVGLIGSYISVSKYLWWRR